MKKKINLFSFAAWVFTVLLLLCVALELTSCNHRKYADVYIESEDSVYNAKQIDDYFNPTFTTIDDVLKYRDKLSKRDFDDSIIRNMPNETLINVSTVLLNKSKIFTQSDIVDEYLRSNTIYDNLPKQSVDPPKDTLKTSITLKDTIIGNNKYKIAK